ncbi:hypothetical protein [Aquitalea sp. ASV15]|uniref:hypothetical protein n=1 Tax=Aquitalea sp. ASV15 TaxID=2795104 RepID=UPI0018ED51D6|nr:hypothetical protein [Aquitalea sp. ASV15]
MKATLCNPASAGFFHGQGWLVAACGRAQALAAKAVYAVNAASQLPGIKQGWSGLVLALIRLKLRLSDCIDKCMFLAHFAGLQI